MRDAPKPPCAFDFAPFLERHRDAIIAEWVDRLHTRSGSQYAQRPKEEIIGTVTEAFDADFHVLAHGDYGPMDRFIEKITRIRLAAGFSLSGVQKAFELFREVVLPLLARELPKDMFGASIAPINHCLAYTIHRFSDYFQEMHEKTIREHNLRLEEQVRVRTAELIEAERMATIGQITASLSHELRNPLSAVKLNLQILKKNLHLAGNDQRRLEISAKEVMRLERILLELLDFAKPLKVQGADCDINRVLSSAVELLELKFKEKGVVLLYFADPDIPSIWADAEKLAQAVINLLLNALEASRPRGRVWVTSRCPAGETDAVHICIEDEGPGVNGEDIEKIFEPFFTSKTKGTGLGLTNVRRIVEAHGGRVEVSPGKFGGAFFDIRLPVKAGRIPQE